MCRYKSEGDPKGLSDCDSLRRENDMNHDLIRDLREEIRVLREERRWIPVGERLPDGEEWVDVASRFGDCQCLAWHDGKDWINVEGNSFPSEVTHWRNRGPGPEVPNG